MPDEINHCDKDSECTCKAFGAESLCKYFVKGFSNGGGCILRMWTGRCASVSAYEAAKHAAMSLEK